MTAINPNARLEALCDGVFAIAMTLLIIEVKLSGTEHITSSSELWHALGHVAPLVFAFVLSFGVILITWVNHHTMMQTVNRSSLPFTYANGLLLLTVVSLPFPTALLGEFVGTDHAAPAVVLYNGVLVVQAVAWILVCSAALAHGLFTDERAAALLREGRRNGYGAFVLYALLAVAALWFPRAVAAITTLSWIFWLVLTIRLRRA
jgi:uncharacterized membrane protein